jgi:hypothetical protein
MPIICRKQRQLLPATALRNRAIPHTHLAGGGAIPRSSQAGLARLPLPRPDTPAIHHSPASTNRAAHIPHRPAAAFHLVFTPASRGLLPGASACPLPLDLLLARRRPTGTDKDREPWRACAAWVCRAPAGSCRSQQKGGAAIQIHSYGMPVG